MNPSIASITIPAIATVSNWVRTAKTFHITATTPTWMVKMLDEFVKGR